MISSPLPFVAPQDSGETRRPAGPAVGALDGPGAGGSVFAAWPARTDAPALPPGLGLVGGWRWSAAAVPGSGVVPGRAGDDDDADLWDEAFGLLKDFGSLAAGKLLGPGAAVAVELPHMAYELFRLGQRADDPDADPTAVLLKAGGLVVDGTGVVVNAVSDLNGAADGVKLVRALVRGAGLMHKLAKRAEAGRRPVRSPAPGWVGGPAFWALTAPVPPAGAPLYPGAIVGAGLWRAGSIAGPPAGPRPAARS